MEIWWLIFFSIILQFGKFTEGQPPYSQCTSAPLVSNGVALPSGPYDNGAGVVYDCEEDYELNGTRQATCSIAPDRNSYYWLPDSVGQFPPTCEYNAYRHRYFISQLAEDEMPLWQKAVLGLVATLLMLMLIAAVIMTCCCIYRRHAFDDIVRLPPKRRAPPPRQMQMRQQPRARPKDRVVFQTHDGQYRNSLAPVKEYPNNFMNASDA